jgi:WD40 repeat protein
LNWIESEKSDREEKLYSISVDGRIVEWGLQKEMQFRGKFSFVHIELFVLKKVTQDQKTNSTSSVFVNRTVGGLCLDFSRFDNSIYIVGTDIGTIHLCSKSYDQYLETYFAHTGPVYKVQFSPYIPSVVISCSEDWTTCLFVNGKVFSLGGRKEPVLDIMWFSPSMFGVITKSGIIEIWDIEFSVLDPLIVQKVLDKHLTCINHCKDNVLVGDESGIVTLLKIKDMGKKNSLESQIERVQQIIAEL